MERQKKGVREGGRKVELHFLKEYSTIFKISWYFIFQIFYSFPTNGWWKKNIVGGISNLFTSRWLFLFVWLTLKREKKMFIYLFIYCIHLEFDKTFIVQFSSGTLVNINNAITTESTENKLTLLPWLH